MAIVIDLPAAKRLAFGVVRGQAAMTLVAALVGWALAGIHAGFSAALGGAIGTVASLAMAVVAFRGKSAASAARILGTFYAGEIVKVAVAIVLARMALPALLHTRRARA